MDATEIWCRVTVVGPHGTITGTWGPSGAGPPDLGVVDRLARLRLAAGRAGATLVLRDVCDELLELIELAGLGDELFGRRRGHQP